MTAVTAKIIYFKKTKNASSSAMLTITDASTQAILESQTIEGRSAWQANWATYTGDFRALNSTQQGLCKQKETYPNDRDLLNQSLRSLESNLGQTLKGFYRRY